MGVWLVSAPHLLLCRAHACNIVVMADEGNADTFVYTLAGRDITFRKTTQAQLLLMQRMLRKVMKRAEAMAQDSDALGDLMIEINDMTFEAVESRFTDPEDLLFVQREILRGNISEHQINSILTNGRPVVIEPDDDADPPKPKRVSKAAPKKTATRRAAR